MHGAVDRARAAGKEFLAHTDRGLMSFELLGHWRRLRLLGAQPCGTRWSPELAQEDNGQDGKRRANQPPASKRRRLGRRTRFNHGNLRIAMAGRSSARSP